MLILLLPGKYKKLRGVRLVIQDFQDINTLEEFGRFLKNERERNGISLEKMQKDTKIRYKYLQSIEEGNFSVLPGGPVYTLGFLKNYARAIGLNEQDIVEKYKQITKKDLKPPKEDLQENIDSQEKIKIKINISESQHSKFMRFGSWALIFIVVIIVGSLFVKNLYTQENQNSSGEEQQLEQQEELSEDLLPVLNENQEQQEPTKPEIEVKETSDSKIVYLVKDDKIEISLEAVTDRCWIRVLTDSEFQYEETIRPGDVRDITGEQQVFIRIGNPGALNITVNMNKIDIPGGKPKDVIFERGD